MASLTPGVLSKLLQNAGNKDVKVTGEHRSALLQVIEIVPCFAGGDDPWQSKGYFLKVSDSLHSAYVSVPEEEAELIYSDKIQLGQFVYVTRLDSASPVPVLRGLKPVPKRRPCVGNPTDLVSSESLPVGANANLDFKKPKKGNKFSTSSSKRNGLVMVGDEKVKSKTASPSNSNANKVQVEGLETRRLSLDSARRVWDQNPLSKNASGTPSSRFKLKSTFTSPNVIEKKLPLKIDSPLKSPTSSISPLKTKNENFSPKLTSTPQKKSIKLPSSGSAGMVPSHLVKVPLNFKTWNDTATSWEDLSPLLCNLGKQVVTHRNVAFWAAVRALEEASAADTVIQCMCMFAELCQSSQTISAGLLVKQFLELHLSLQRGTMILESLLTPTPETKSGGHSSLHSVVEDACKVPCNKNAISWVQAAMGTNLSKFNLFRTQAKSEVLNGEKCHYVVIENSPEETNTKNSSAQNKQNHVTEANILRSSTGKRLYSSKRHLLVAKSKDMDKPDQSKESKLKEAASLAEKLLVTSCEWFLKYLEESLCNGFGLKSEEGSTEIACLLGQLKKVNHWLDNFVGGDRVDHRVENLRKRLYRFLLEHVDSAVASSK